MFEKIFKKRLARSLGLSCPKAIKRLKASPDSKRRAGFTRGAPPVLVRPVNVKLTEKDFQRLETICSRLRVQRGVIIRDALEFYLGMVEQEVLELDPVTILDTLPTQIAPDKVRRPDGAIVNLFDSDPTFKGSKKQKEVKAVREGRA